MSNKEPLGFGRFKRKAEELLRNVPELSRLAVNAAKKAVKNSHAIEKGWDDLTTLNRLVRAYAKGQYKEVPRQTIVVVVAAILYFVSPFDVIPDFLPLIGFMDDLGVLGFVVRGIKGDIDRFREWEKGEPTALA